MPFFVSSQSLLQWRHFFLWHCHFCVISAVLSVVTVHPLPTQSFVTPSQQTMPTCVILTRHTNTKTVHVQVCYLCSCRAMDACAYIRVGLVANRRVGGVLVAAPALWGRNTNSTAMSSRSFTRQVQATDIKASVVFFWAPATWFMACPYMYVRLFRAQGKPF